MFSALQLNYNPLYDRVRDIVVVFFNLFVSKEFLSVSGRWISSSLTTEIIVEGALIEFRPLDVSTKLPTQHISQSFWPL